MVTSTRPSCFHKLIHNVFLRSALSLSIFRSLTLTLTLTLDTLLSLSRFTTIQCYAFSSPFRRLLSCLRLTSVLQLYLHATSGVPHFLSSFFFCPSCISMTTTVSYNLTRYVFFLSSCFIFIVFFFVFTFISFRSGFSSSVLLSYFFTLSSSFSFFSLCVCFLFSFFSFFGQDVAYFSSTYYISYTDSPSIQTSCRLCENLQPGLLESSLKKYRTNSTYFSLSRRSYICLFCWMRLYSFFLLPVLLVYRAVGDVNLKGAYENGVFG